MVIQKKIRGMVFGCALLAAALACGWTTAASSNPTDENVADQSVHPLSYQGRNRSYLLHVPASTAGKESLPLVIVLHGGTGNGESAVRMSGFNAVADRYGVIAAYPNGTGRAGDNLLLTWNGGSCCAYAETAEVDDVGFLRAVVEDIRAHYAIDRNRVFATGLSNGAIMSQRLACEAADVFAAIAPVAGTLNFSGCHPGQPVSVIEFHGTDDQHIPYDGGYGPKSLVHVNFASVAATLAFWSAADGCASQPESSVQGSVRHDVWTHCAQGAAVELYTIEGGGHAWPGGAGGWADSDTPTQAISASQLIWDFFAAHPRR
jgi:polyhydroxybutyrate depolymerase